MWIARSSSIAGCRARRSSFTCPGGSPCSAWEPVDWDCSPTGKRPFHVELEVPDLAAAAAGLRGLGFEIDGPTRRQWGEEDVLVTDPDGNLLEFAAPRGRE
jgi:catechol 2,3-dioxygenase-like lactoylglutathione lyase family enzyme